MIQAQSIVQIADNSGAKLGRVFKVLGSSKKRYASIGELVVLSVQKADPSHRNKLVKRKDIVCGIVVRQRAPFRRKDGTYVRFDENAVVILDDTRKEPMAGRIFGPVPREVGELGFQKIVSLAPEVV